MSEKLVPSDPAKVMVIRDVVPRVITTLSVPFWRFGKIKIGGRGTIVRLATGNLAVFSPVALTDEVKAKVASLGEVRYICAPDAEHHIFLGPWHAAYPQAQIMGPETLPELRAKDKSKESVPFTHLFKESKRLDSVSAEFDAEFDWEYVPSHANKEILFHHRPTRTLIEADYLFNSPSTEQFSKTGVDASSGIFTKIFGALTSTQGKALAQQRMIWWGTSAGDRKGFAASTARIDKWDFDRIIPCHGDVIETGGKEVFRKVLSWHLELARKEGFKES
ncbi:hypothetical protein B5807_07900 [Epicoccum nigrum]|uniref:DUF4336 domain-containing protein n=1 Tax=Epicoccum nigrum TaxID=105696 RepID=A0A1Y2LWQ1_EPING|nr:hypothetical protein G6514_005790 [Epicoccum nigrum]OSS48283.1 hypothetical protein B5807_07900 [Epicoccum nigrum]